MSLCTTASGLQALQSVPSRRRRKQRRSSQACAMTKPVLDVSATVASQNGASPTSASPMNGMRVMTKLKLFSGSANPVWLHRLQPLCNCTIVARPFAAQGMLALIVPCQAFFCNVSFASMVTQRVHSDQPRVLLPCTIHHTNASASEMPTRARMAAVAVARGGRAPGLAARPHPHQALRGWRDLCASEGVHPRLRCVPAAAHVPHRHRIGE